MRFSRIIDDLGGYRELAKELGVHPTTAFKWRKTGIPAKYFRDVVAMARKKDMPEITLEALHAADHA